jgi:hypothetical protein
MVNSSQDKASLAASERRLVDLAAHLTYPPTPDIAARERQRLENAGSEPCFSTTGAGRRVKLLASAAAASILLLAVALLVPQTRASLFRIFDIGAVRIEADEQPREATIAPGRALLDIAGATTLAEASTTVGFDILLPAYPADLGLPDRVYVQKLFDPGLDGLIAILVWLDQAQPDQAKLSLYQIPVPAYALKQASIKSVRQTMVDGHTAFWVQGPHRLQLRNGDYDEWLFVPGSALVWTDGQLTYRLESGLSLDEAVRIAESLSPLEQ